MSRRAEAIDLWRNDLAVSRELLEDVRLTS
jgi:hypothetical protein